MECGLEDCYAVVFEHVEELEYPLEILVEVSMLASAHCCFAGIIEAEK